MLLRTLVAVVSLLAFPPRDAAACSVCGCDPAAGTLGLDRPSSGALRIGLEDRYLYKESGQGTDAESEREDRLVLRAQYAPLERLVLQAELPYFIFKKHLNDAGVQDDNATGLGDVTLAARYELLRVGLDARHAVALTGTLKLPTGPNAREVNGVQDEHIQLGTGSYDGIAGISYLYGLQPWTLYANLSGRLNSANGRGFRYGNALFATVGARRSFFASGRLIASLDAQARHAGKDRSPQGFDPHSGGFVGYATGSVAYAITDDLLFRVLAQIPAVTSLNGVQSEHPVLYASLTYDLPL